MELSMVLARMFPGVDLCDLSPMTQSRNYADLARTWRSKQHTLPTEVQMRAVWAQIVAERPVLALPPKERREKLIEEGQLRFALKLEELKERARAVRDGA